MTTVKAIHSGSLVSYTLGKFETYEEAESAAKSLQKKRPGATCILVGPGGVKFLK